MTDATFPGGENVRKRAIEYLKYWSKAKPSEAGIRIAELLELWQGLHHMDNEDMRKIDWTRFFVEIRFFDSFATFDFDALTRLVFLSHDLAIRADIGKLDKRYCAITFHPRTRDGTYSQRHPTIEDALASWRKIHPASASVQVSIDTGASATV